MKKSNLLFAAVGAVCVLFSNQAYSQWFTGGNAIGAADWLGGNNTTTNPFIVKTYGFERIRILSNANSTPRIGINNTAPSLALDLISNATNDGVRITNSGTTAAALNLQSNDAGGHRWALFSTGSGNSQGVGNFSIYDYTAGTDRLFINGSGNVGVGTTAPVAKLQVNGWALFTDAWSVPTSAAVIRATSSNSTATTPEYTWWNNDQTGFFHPGSDIIGFTTGGGEKMRIIGNGNIGIGTTNPTAKLTVNGNVLIGDPATVNLPAGYKLYVETGVLAEKVKVTVKNTANWADYVFANDYKLKSVDELENFIQENKHLPNVPSAQEVVKEGLDVAAMDAKLLEKIEELTLYIIEQNKRIAALEKNTSEK